MTNIDFSKLATQYANNYSGLESDKIMYIYTYHPWDNGNNPKIDKITNNLLNLKKNQESAINFFSKVLKTQLEKLVKNEKNKVFCVVPSHKAKEVSQGLLKIMSNISSGFEFQNSKNLLVRDLTVTKSATGGDRSVQHHLNSISAVDEKLINGKTVFLFDDISSTGNSMEACKKLLIDSGATKVFMVSLGQTAKYN